MEIIVGQRWLEMKGEQYFMIAEVHENGTKTLTTFLSLDQIPT
jgi:hypothetical protein